MSTFPTREFSVCVGFLGVWECSKMVLSSPEATEVADAQHV